MDTAATTSPERKTRDLATSPAGAHRTEAMMAPASATPAPIKARRDDAWTATVKQSDKQGNIGRQGYGHQPLDEGHRRDHREHGGRSPSSPDQRKDEGGLEDDVLRPLDAEASGKRHTGHEENDGNPGIAPPLVVGVPCPQAVPPGPDALNEPLPFTRRRSIHSRRRHGSIVAWVSAIEHPP